MFTGLGCLEINNQQRTTNNYEKGQSLPTAAAYWPPHRCELTADEYFSGVLANDVPILARALTLIESTHPRHQRLAEDLLTRLFPHTGGSIRVGITGAPGVGK